MNRNRLVSRTYETSTDKARRLAQVLAETCDEEFLERLIAHKAALDEFGGELYISAARQKFSNDGQAVEHPEVGAYETIGYIFNYSHRARIRGQVQEPDVALTEAEPPVANGSDPEPVAVAD